jgi:mono/diheme cytochrome c family protein
MPGFTKVRKVTGIFTFAAVPLLIVTAATLSAGADPARVDYNRDVQPILSNNCFACHGFDPKTRMAGLRLDTREGALERQCAGRLG